MHSVSMAHPCNMGEPVEQHQSPDIARLAGLLRHQEIDKRWEAASALSRCGSEALKPLIRNLYDDDTGVRMLSIWALGRMGNEQALTHIMHTLHDEDPVIRLAGEGALSRLMRK